MKLRAQLVLAFLLLAVVPLAGITLYSYFTSTRAFRQALQEESAQLTVDMTRNMKWVREELDQRVQDLGVQPFYRLAGTELRELEPDVEGIYTAVLNELGDAASLIDSLEFEPGLAGEFPGQSVSPAPPALPDELRERLDEFRQSVVVYLPGTELVVSADSESQPPSIEEEGNQEVAVVTATGEELVLSHRPVPLPPSPPPPAGSVAPLAGRELPARQPWLRELRLHKLKERRRAALQQKRAMAVLNVGLGGPPEARKVKRAECLDFEAQVPMSESLACKITAQVNVEEVLGRVLVDSRMDPDEIPFAIAPDGQVFTPFHEKAEVLDRLKLARGDASRVESLEGEWLLVTKEDPSSGITFGIARPMSEGLQRIRQTMAKNLGYGVLMIGVALLGILPLSGRMTRNLNSLMDGAQKLSGGDLDARVPVRSRDEFGRLSATFNQMASDLKLRQDQLLEQERMRKELEMCRHIQKEMLPKAPLLLPFAEIQGISIPAREVGGDFFNYFSMASGEVAILVGDVSGKGVPAALLMANIQATLRAKLPVSPDLAELLRQLDEEVNAATPVETFLTLFLAIFDPARETLRWVNAGHNTQYLQRTDGSLEQLASSGRPLGLLPGSEFRVEESQFASGDLLFLYTDGLVEAEDAEEREFGNDRLEAILRDERRSPTESLLHRLEEAVENYRADGDAGDDATMVVLRRS